MGVQALEHKLNCVPSTNNSAATVRCVRPYMYAFPPARQSHFTTPVKQGRIAGFGPVPSSALGNISDHLPNAAISKTRQTLGPHVFRSINHFNALRTLHMREFRTMSVSHTTSGRLRARSSKHSFDCLSSSTQTLSCAQTDLVATNNDNWLDAHATTTVCCFLPPPWVSLIYL
eukprot:333408_1